MEKPVTTSMKVVFTSQKEVKEFLLKDTFLLEILLYAAKISRHQNFAIEVFENEIRIEDAVPTTNNMEEIENLKTLFRNYSKDKNKKLLLKNKVEFQFALI